MDEDDAAFDDQRWGLLGWMLGTSADFMTAVRAIPNERFESDRTIRVAIIALNVLLKVSIH